MGDKNLLPGGKTIPDVWTENEHRAMDILKVRRESVCVFPDPVVKTTKDLLERVPVLSERNRQASLHGHQLQLPDEREQICRGFE
jgi:hypothetical protein